MRCSLVLLTPFLLAGALGACTPTPAETAAAADASARNESRIASVLHDRIAGRPTDCVQQTQLRGSDNYGKTILYRGIGDQIIYRNDTSGGCRSFREGYALVSRTPTDQLCRGDILNSVDPHNGMSGGSCSLGEFVPYTRAERMR